MKITDLTPEIVRDHNPELYEAIRKTVDPEDKIRDIEAQLEAKETEITKHKEKREKLHGKLEKAGQMIDELKGKIDKHEAAEKLKAKKEAINELIKEAELPEELVTEWFVESLMKMKEEDMQAAIEDRKSLNVKKEGDEIKGMGDEHDEEEETEITESDKKKVEEALDL